MHTMEFFVLRIRQTKKTTPRARGLASPEVKKVHLDARAK